MKPPAPSLSDVAAQAGVSKSTVSRILNNRLGNGFSVKEEVRLRVIEIARKLNYRPNLIAKSLTMRSTKMIHIIGGNHALSQLGNIYQTVVNHITEVIDSQGQGFDVTVDMSKHKTDESEMPAWKIDGAIILARCTEPTMEEILQLGIPYVVINGPAPAGGTSVVPDDVQGTRLAVKHLFELGHRKIAYTPPPQKYMMVGHSSIADRQDTYIDQMKRNGLEPLISALDVLDNTERLLQELVFEKKTTAILAYGHMEALNLLQAAHSLEIPVPERLSLMCFCDHYANQIMSPGLTFIDLGSAQMGTLAAQLLLEQITQPGKQKPNRVVLNETLCARGTTAPPPSSEQLE